jgi:hypothetical protein
MASKTRFWPCAICSDVMLLNSNFRNEVMLLSKVAAYGLLIEVVVVALGFAAETLVC